MQKMKSITDAISDFSKRLSRFEKAESAVFVKKERGDKILQTKINLSEEEKLEKIRAEYEKYINPVSKEIEEDEEAVLSALRIFKAAKLAEQGETSAIHEIDFKSPLCRKDEYIYDNKLVYLSFWLENVHGEKEWTPNIYKHISGERFLEFIPLENRTYDYEKNAVLKILEKLNNEKKAGKTDDKVQQ